jgi:lysophospholipase L1-like esterase
VGVDEHEPGCSEFRRAAMERIQATPGLSTVVLVSRWTTAAEGRRFGAVGANGLFITDAETRRPGYAENRPVFIRGLARTVRSLGGRHVIVVAHIPEQRVNVPQAAALAAKYGRAGELGTARSLVERREAGVRAALQAVVANGDVTVVDVTKAMCDARRCPATADGRSLYFDDNHLSAYGARRLAELVRLALSPPLAGDI